METFEMCPESYDHLSRLLEQFYGDAYLTLEAGATKEDLIGQIDEAFECLQSLKEDGLLRGPGTAKTP